MTRPAWRRWRPAWRFAGRDVRDLAGYNLNTWGSYGLGYLEQQLPRIIIGRVLGAEAVDVEKRARVVEEIDIDKTLADDGDPVVEPADDSTFFPYVRLRIDDTHSRAAARLPVIVGHLLGVGLAAAGISQAGANWLALLPFVAFLARAGWVALKPRPIPSMKRLCASSPCARW